MNSELRTSVLVVTSAAAFIAGLDNLVVTFALPAMQRQFHLDVTELSWTVNAYTLTFAMFMLAAAAMGDRIGRRLAFQIGVAIFTVASIAVALAPGIEFLTAARALQGLGAAILVPLSLTLLVQDTSHEKRPVAIAIWSSAQGLATAIGPLVGGAIVQFVGWQWAFWINVPIGIALAVFAGRVLRDAKQNTGRFDWIGLVTLSAAVLALVLALTLGGGNRGALPAMALGAAGAGLLFWFFGHERRTKTPVVNPRLWRSMGFTLTNVTALLVTAGMFGVVFLLTQYLQKVMGFAALQAGLLTLPWTLLPVIAAPLAGKLVARLGTNAILTVGSALQAISLAWFAWVIRPDVPYLQLLPGLIFAGLGMGAFFAVLATQALSYVRTADEGIASGINNFVRELGVLVGVAALTAVFVASGSQGNAANFTVGLRASLWAGVVLLGLAVIASAVTPRKSPTQDTVSPSANQRVRVLWITSGWLPEVGGPSIGNFDRAIRLSERKDMELVILAPAHPEAATDPSSIDVRRYASKTWAPYPAFRVPTFAARTWLESQIATISPDVIVNTDVERMHLFSTWRLPGRTWALRNAITYIGYYHTDFYGFSASYPLWKHLRHFTLRPLIARLYRSLDITIAASDTSAEQLVGFGLRPEEIARLPFDGVDTSVFTPERRPLPSLAGATSDEKTTHRTVLSLGRIAPEKRIDLTVRAVANLIRDERRRDLRLVVVGEGPGETLDGLKRLAADLIPEDQVSFRPFVHGDEKAVLLASADVFALPSPHETFSITTAEAMASGTPVVCANSGAPRTYVTDGVNGFLCEPDSTDSLALGLERALSCDRELIGFNARNTISESFSMDSIAQGFGDFLINLVRSRAVTPDLHQKGTEQ